MDKYANNDKSIRLNRYLQSEYKPAVEKYFAAKSALENWSKDMDTLVYQLCADCSSKLYEAVEHFLREAIGEPELTEGVRNLNVLCSMLKEDPRLIDVELSVFVTKKGPRNESTHLGRLTELGDYHRIICNMNKLIKVCFPELNVQDVGPSVDSFDYCKFWCDVDEFQTENTNYILMIDPVNDLSEDIVRRLFVLPWNMIIDFDGKNTDGKIGKYLLNSKSTQMCDIRNVRNQGITEVTFKLKKAVYLSMETEVAPRLKNKWTGRDKDNFEFWVEKSKTLEKDKAIVVLAKAYDSISQIFIDKIIDVYGNENVRLLFLEDSFDSVKVSELEEEYENICYYNTSSIITSLKNIASHQEIKEETTSAMEHGVRLPTYDGVIAIDSRALLENMNQYFEIIDLNKGHDESNIYSEETFLKGALVSWEALRLGYDILPIAEGTYREFKDEVVTSLKTVESKNKVFSILHKPGYGGTTLARRLAWDIHTEYPVLLLERYNASETWGILTAFYEFVKKGILIVADENNISKSEMDEIEKAVENSLFPVTVLKVGRIRYTSANSGSTKNLFLTFLEKESCDRLEQKCCNLAKKKFNDSEIKNRKKLLDRVPAAEKCPILIGLYYLEELFEGTEDYVRRFVNDLNGDVDADNIKNAMCIVSMCDYFGQKTVFPVLLNKALNPTNLRGFNVKEAMKKVRDLFNFETINGSTYIKSKHYLLSKEIIKQLFVGGKENNNWKDYIAEQSISFIDLTVSVCSRGIDPDLQMLLKDMFIENRDTEYLRGKFSVLIESCSADEDREKILVYLANSYDEFLRNTLDIESQTYNEYQLLAHFWGHLGRFYSQKGRMNNPQKAEDCCKKALEYSERMGYYDYIILHIAGDSTSKRIQSLLESVGTEAEIGEMLPIIVDGVCESQDLFEKSIIYGNEEYGKVGLLTLWSHFLNCFFNIFNITSVFDTLRIEDACKKINRPGVASWIFEGISNVIELIEYTDYNNYSDVAQAILLNIKADLEPKLMNKNLSTVLEELNNYLNKLNNMPIKDSKKISNAKRLIIRNILMKYRDDDKVTYSKFISAETKARKDLNTIMEYINDNLGKDSKKDSDFALWFALMRYSDVSVDEAIRKAKEWLDFQQQMGIVDPRPAYYLYVFYYLRALEGYTNSVDEAEKYKKICHKICDDKRRDNSVVNYSRVRDWLGIEKGVKALIDDRGVDYSNVVKDNKILNVKAKFVTIDPSNRRVYGYMEIIEPISLRGVQVFFKPLECGVSSQQIEHIFEMKIGFSYERLVAFDKSVRDVTMEKYSNQKEECAVSKKEIEIGDIAHMNIFDYQNDKKRLRGNLLENGKRAFLRQGEIAYDHYVTDREMEEYVGVDNVEVLVIDYNSMYDYYIVSIRKLLLGNSKDKPSNTMSVALQGIKL